MMTPLLLFRQLWSTYLAVTKGSASLQHHESPDIKIQRTETGMRAMDRAIIHR